MPLVTVSLLGSLMAQAAPFFLHSSQKVDLTPFLFFFTFSLLSATQHRFRRAHPHTPPSLHKMLPVDEHVPIALGLLGKAAGTGGQVVPVLHTAQLQSIEIDDIDVGEGAGDQRAAAL